MLINSCVSFTDNHKMNFVQVNDSNKRKVLENIIHLIRFPVMDSETFIKSVISTEILTDAEAMNVLLLLKGSKPREKLPFSSKERPGVWREIMCRVRQSEINEVATSQSDSVFKIPFTVQCARKVSICSVFLLMAPGCTLENVLLQSTVSKMHRVQNRLQDIRQPLHEVTFDPPVTVTAGERGVVAVHTTVPHSRGHRNAPHLNYGYGSGGPPQNLATVLKGQNRITDKGVTISIDSSPWHFVVGFKYKKVP